ncbi:ATP-binding cassette domain-containing protein [Pontibacillus yanchengensis]|uniref:ATP-binding cassette domain-containing protein n=2 Tax=Pontibacillus yanchengensis TaxID=462910 RepID=A0ACC7VEH7_9BACI|nr:ABC transporter ATP-binding protein [Pontibacillus yanchengensis]MYL32494.1 ATP-binding cassette domain-containing protein [Pontibacillus yanchengensis]MYL53075.1 ATP-binding cassette domain-containing protein [Pontibacillus yanchengensis]
MITLKEVSKSYKKKEVLAPTTLEIEEGGAYGIVGPNGAGKSTLLKLIASLERPTKGTIYYQGKSYTSSVKNVRQSIGYIPQEIALYEELTVKEQLDFWSNISPKKIDDAFVQNMKQTLRLDEVANQRIQYLSGGWKRKLNLCVGLIHNPSICLLDEPTAGIDLAAKEDILTWLKALHQQGKTLLYISHDRHELHTLSDQFIVLLNGHVVFHDDKEVFHRTKSQLLKNQEEHQELEKILSYL